jgi:phosphoglycolate phosphatase
MKAIDIVRFDNFIFDLDGTLVDSAIGIQAAAEFSWNLFFPNKPMPEFRQHIGPPIKVIFRNLLPQASNNELNLIVGMFREAYDQWGWKMTKLFDDVTSFLTILERAGCCLYGVTNKPSQPTTRILRALDIENRFLIFLSPDSPDHLFFNKSEGVQQLLDEYQLVKEKTVMIGDSSDDAEAAYLTGIAFIYRTRDPNKKLLVNYPILQCCNNLSECESFIGGSYAPNS